MQKRSKPSMYLIKKNKNRISLLSYVLGQYKPKPPVLSSEILCLGTKLCSYELILGPHIEEYNIHIIFSGKIKYLFLQMQFKKNIFLRKADFNCAKKQPLIPN